MSMKKSLLLLVCVIAAVTVFSIFSSGGNSMQIEMNDTSIFFSGIDDFRHEVAYADILSVTMEEVTDWSVYGGHEFGPFRVGHMTDYVLFITTQSNKVIVATLADGSRMVFNYNNAYATEQIYSMVLENLK